MTAQRVKDARKVASARKGSVSLPLKGVVFDLDDTICRESDYEMSGIRAVCAWASASLGYDYGTSLMALTARYQRMGQVTPELFAAFVAESGRPEAHGRIFGEVFRSHRPEIAAINGAIPMVEMLRFRYRTAVMAAGDMETGFHKLTALGLFGRFDTAYPQSEYGVQWTRKQVLDWFQLFFEAESDEIAYVGSSRSKGFDVARAMGWHTVLVKNARRNGAPVQVPRSAQRTVDNILEVEKLLHTLGPAARPTQDAYEANEKAEEAVAGLGRRLRWLGAVASVGG